MTGADSDLSKGSPHSSSKQSKGSKESKDKKSSKNDETKKPTDEGEDYLMYKCKKSAFLDDIVNSNEE